MSNCMHVRVYAGVQASYIIHHGWEKSVALLVGGLYTYVGVLRCARKLVTLKINVSLC